MTNNELIMTETSTNEVMEQLKNPNSNLFCSIKDDGTRKSKIKIFNAVNSNDNALADHVGEVLEIVDVVAHPVKLEDDVTHELVESVRTVLVDKKGVSYTAVSEGVTSALSKIFSIIGMPSWVDEPVKMKVRQVKTRKGNNKVTTLELVE